MIELRRVRKVGGSLTVTIPPNTVFVEGDWIKFDVVIDDSSNDRVILRKVIV